MSVKCRIAPCLWFDGQAEEAAKFYCGIFPDAKIVATSYYSQAGKEVHGHAAGSVLTVEFELDGLHFTALNGGPQFRFSEAISFQIDCATQDEIDHYWHVLSADGGSKGECGWLKDHYGLSWQTVPADMVKWITDTPAATERVMAALMPMKKLDLAALRRAYEG